MASNGDIVFLGRNGYECEEFIRAIRKAAYAAGRIRDDAWMTDLASTCFSGRALRYYETLDQDVRSDWGLLCRALLRRYPPLDDNEDGMQVRETRTLQFSVPREELGPPLQAQTGRIKVIGANSSDWGYLGGGASLGAGASASDALSVCYSPGNSLFEIEIKRPDGEPQVLGVHWDAPSPSMEVGSPNYAALAAFNYEGSYRSSTITWAGPGCTRIWKVTPDNIIRPHMEVDGFHKPLRTFVFSSSAKPYQIDAAADAGALP